MSIGTQSKGCDGPLYPQWGETRGVDIDEVDWSGIDEYFGTGSGVTVGAEDSGIDDEGGVVVDLDEEPWRDDGTPEPWGPDAGATTAEYAITTLAACGFAALLVVILKSEPIKELVTGVIQTALGLGA